MNGRVAATPASRVSTIQEIGVSFKLFPFAALALGLVLFNNPQNERSRDFLSKILGH